MCTFSSLMPWKAGEHFLHQGLSENTTEFLFVYYGNFHFMEDITKASLQDSLPKLQDIHMQVTNSTQDMVLSHGSALWMFFPNFSDRLKLIFIRDFLKLLAALRFISTGQDVTTCF